MIMQDVFNNLKLLIFFIDDQSNSTYSNILVENIDSDIPKSHKPKIIMRHINFKSKRVPRLFQILKDTLIKNTSFVIKM